jgi:hypothetical protein
MVLLEAPILLFKGLIETEVSTAGDKPVRVPVPESTAVPDDVDLATVIPVTAVVLPGLLYFLIVNEVVVPQADPHVNVT